MFNWATVVEIIGMFAAWALGLYVVTRSPRNLLSIAAALTLFAIGLFWLQSSLQGNLRDLSEYQFLGGKLWWTGAVAAAFWFWTSALVLRRETTRSPGEYLRFAAYPLGVALVAAAVVLGVLAATTDEIVKWSEPITLDRDPSTSASFLALPGPLFTWAGVMIDVALVLALGHLGWAAWRFGPGSIARRQASWLTVSTVFFLFGGNWLVVNALVGEELPRAFGVINPGHLFLIVGLGIVGWSSVRHGTWIEGEPERGDFAYYLTGLGIVVALYAGVIALIGINLDLQGLTLLFTLGLLTLTTHALADVGRITLGRLFYPSAWQAQARFLAYADRAARATDHTTVLREAARETDDQWWYEQTERALRELRNPHALSQSDLIERLLSDGQTPLDRARGLSDLLVTSIDKLDPGDGREPPRLCVILRESYVNGRTTKQIMIEHQIPDRTYFNERRKGVAAVAVELRAIAAS